jgi:hypothetical protein
MTRAKSSRFSSSRFDVYIEGCIESDPLNILNQPR